MNGSIFRRSRPLVLAGVSLLLLVGTLTACAGAGDDGTEPAVYTEADRGRTVKALVGDSITIRLSENPSTGYSWKLRQSGGLELHADDFLQPTASPGLVGAPGTRVLTLEVTGSGTQSVDAVYERPWEPGGRSGMEQEFSLTIAVE